MNTHENVSGFFTPNNLIPIGAPLKVLERKINCSQPNEMEFK
jgi:hypothetical protein